MDSVPAEKEASVLIVIPHHLGGLVFRCLDSVKKQYAKGLHLTTVVVTSSTTCFSGGVKTLFDPGGPAQKRNRTVGFYGQKADYLVFLDDDVELAPYCIWNLVEFIKQKPLCGMAFCKILNMERRTEFDDCGSWITGTGFLWARAGNNQQDRGQFDEPQQVLSSKSATCIVRRDAFLQAGGFDSDYFILGEETDLAWRIWLKGWECWYTPSPKSWHAFNTSLKPKEKYYNLERIHFHGCKNYISLLFTNLGSLRLCLILPIHLIIWGASAGLFLILGQWRRSWQILRGMFWCARHFSRLVEKRRKVQSTRTVTDRTLWPRISYSPPLSYYFGRMRRYISQQIHG